MPEGDERGVRPDLRGGEQLGGGDAGRRTYSDIRTMWSIALRMVRRSAGSPGPAAEPLSAVGKSQAVGVAVEDRDPDQPPVRLLAM